MLSYSEIERKIGYIFNNKDLLRVAITHKSYAYEKTKVPEKDVTWIGLKEE